MAALDALAALFPHTARTEWLMLFQAERLVDDQRQPVTADSILRAGQRLYQKMPGITEPPVNANIRLLHEDEAILVLEKPAPLPMHPCGRFNRNTLQHLIHLAYAPQKPRPCHRLDANTSGLVVLARTRHFARLVQAQFAQGQVEKTYLARVNGHPTWDNIVCELPIRSEAGDLGARDVDEQQGDDARTEFRVLARDADNTALVEARPITGRTNQIRVHLWQLSHAILGDPTYLPGGGIGDTQTLPPDAPPMCLHATRLRFTHPLTGQIMTFESSPPFHRQAQ
jgi:RluA family pseudouridine synthase